MRFDPKGTLPLTLLVQQRVKSYINNFTHQRGISLRNNVSRLILKHELLYYIGRSQPPCSCDHYRLTQEIHIRTFEQSFDVALGLVS